jgi:hypothetical protein
VAEAEDRRRRGTERSAKRGERSRIRTLPASEVPAEPKTLDDVARFKAWVVIKTATGEIDARTAHELLYGLNGLRQTIEKRDLAREVLRLRREVERLRQQSSPRGRRARRAV